MKKIYIYELVFIFIVIVFSLLYLDYKTVIYNDTLYYQSESEMYIMDDEDKNKLLSYYGYNHFFSKYNIAIEDEMKLTTTLYSTLNKYSAHIYIKGKYASYDDLTLLLDELNFKPSDGNSNYYISSMNSAYSSEFIRVINDTDFSISLSIDLRFVGKGYFIEMISNKMIISLIEKLLILDLLIIGLFNIIYILIKKINF